MLIYYGLLSVLVSIDIYNFNKNKATHTKKEYVLYIIMTLIAIILGFLYFKYGTFNIAETFNRFMEWII